VRASSLIAWALILSACSGLVGAQQRSSYDNPGEVRGAAARLPALKQLVVHEVLDYCAALAPARADTMKASIRKWHERNRALVRAGDKVRAQIEAEVRGSVEASAVAAMFASEPALNQQVARVLLDKIAALPDEDSKRAMCLNISVATDNGQFDIASDHPDVVALLRSNQD
jgi:hypothetical protein